MLKKIKGYFKTPKGFGQLVNTISIFAPRKSAEIAFRIFCTPRKGRSFSKSQNALLNRSEQERLPLRDFELQTYVWKGGQEKVLLVHGWDSNASRWKAVISTLLSENYTVIAFDGPGHGKSGNKTTNGVLYAEAVEKVTQRFRPDYVIGHSFGGMAVCNYFANFDALPIKRLILMATPSKLSRVLVDYYKIINYRNRGQKALKEYFDTTYGFTAESFSMEDYIKKVNVKGLVIHDKNDETTPFSEGKAIHKNWKNSSFFEVENIGHSLQHKSVYLKIVEEIKKGK
ncbi:MAG: alpha/beta fold hydrolase [Saprospiraceae bacterium]